MIIITPDKELGIDSPVLDFEIVRCTWIFDKVLVYTHI